MNLRIAIEAGATAERTGKSVARISFWYIPGGCDYTNARIIVVYFDDMELAKKFEEEYSCVPEMAVLEKLT